MGSSPFKAADKLPLCHALSVVVSTAGVADMAWINDLMVALNKQYQ